MGDQGHIYGSCEVGQVSGASFAHMHCLSRNSRVGWLIGGLLFRVFAEDRTEASRRRRRAVIVAAVSGGYGPIQKSTEELVRFNRIEPFLQLFLFGCPLTRD